MGVFSLFKSSDNGTKAVDVNKELLSFLKQTDELYMAAYQLKSTKDISKFLSRECASRLSSTVCSINVRYFGEPKYRTTVWINEKDSNGIINIRKEVTFDNLRIAGKLAISIASDYSERWVVLKEGSKFVVDRIQQLA